MNFIGLSILLSACSVTASDELLTGSPAYVNADAWWDKAEDFIHMYRESMANLRTTMSNKLGSAYSLGTPTPETGNLKHKVRLDCEKHINACPDIIKALEVKISELKLDLTVSKVQLEEHFTGDDGLLKTVKEVRKELEDNIQMYARDFDGAYDDYMPTYQPPNPSVYENEFDSSSGSMSDSSPAFLKTASLFGTRVVKGRESLSLRLKTSEELEEKQTVECIEPELEKTFEAFVKYGKSRFFNSHTKDLQDVKLSKDLGGNYKYGSIEVTNNSVRYGIRKVTKTEKTNKFMIVLTTQPLQSGKTQTISLKFEKKAKRAEVFQFLTSTTL